MTFLAPRHPGPRYVRVANALRQKILDGLYRVGERLAPQHQLAREYGVAFTTLKQALDLLEGEGYIVRKHGRGTYAATPSRYRGSALVVDDNAAFREVLIRLLGQYNWAAEGAEDGYQALNRVREGGFDLIFLHLMMPGMNGAETMARIRELDQGTPVVFVTAYPDSELMARALELGPVTVLRKPFAQEDLAQVLHPRGRI